MANKKIDFTIKLNSIIINCFTRYEKNEELLSLEIFEESLKIALHEFFKKKKYQPISVSITDGYPLIEVLRDKEKTFFWLIPFLDFKKVNPITFLDDNNDMSLRGRANQTKSNVKVIYINLYSTYLAALSKRDDVKGQTFISSGKLYFGAVRLQDLNLDKEKENIWQEN